MAKKLKFIRYGSLVPQYHKRDEIWFHTAPVEMGFYAFPEHYKEMFLLGGVGHGNIRNGRYRFLKDENGKKLMVALKDFYEEPSNGCCYYDKWRIKEEYEKLLKSQKLTWKDVFPYVEDENGIFDGCMPTVEESEGKLYPIRIENKPRKFTYSGNLWHHLDVANENGSVKLVAPGDIIRRSGSWIETTTDVFAKALKKYDTIRKNSTFQRGHYSGCASGVPNSWFDNDNLEVFIERIQ